MSRTRVRFGRLALTGDFLLGAAMLAGGAAAGTTTPERPAEHVVVQGDTLWSIARRSVGAEGDPRPLVEAIRSANGLATASLVPGRVLLIPLA